MYEQCHCRGDIESAPVYEKQNKTEKINTNFAIDGNKLFEVHFKING